jgi:hypothetical protein
MITESAPEVRFQRLRRYNLGMGLLHLAQAVAVLVLANDFTLPVTADYLAGPQGSEPPPPTLLFDSPIALWVAAFLFLSALAHFVLVLPGVFDWYVANLKRDRNYARWLEYSVSSSIMIVLIAQLTGLSDIVALLAIFAVNATMIGFGALQERYHSPGDGHWLPFWLGCLAGAVPWVAIAIYALAPGADTAVATPTFVIFIFISLFVLFNSFAVNMYLQYRQVGRWRDYIYGESAYILLSLVAKSLLAWQIFGSTLAG